MIRVPWSRVGAVLAATTLAGSLLAASAGSGLAANTRNVYFGAPPDVCPSSVTTAYPDTGCGGGIAPDGTALYGTEVFSPTTVSTTTATAKLVGYRLEIANRSGSTLTHVVLLGGALAGLTTNPLFPPPSAPCPGPYDGAPCGLGGSLPSFTASDGTVQGFSYAAWYVDSGPSPVCAITSTARQSDSLRCDFGNIPATAEPTVLTIVMLAPSALPSNASSWAVRPWNELQLNEGSSSSGSNVDSFYTVGMVGGLSATPTTQDYAETFVLPTGGGLTTSDTFSPTPTDPTVTRVSQKTTPDGDDARIEETGLPSDSAPGCGAGLAVTCFGQTSNVDVLTPVNITVNGAATQLPELFGDCPTDAMGNVTDYTHCTVSSTVAPLKIELAWDGSEVPGPANVRKLVVVHTDFLDVTSVVPICTNVPPLPGDALPCRTDAYKVGKKGLGDVVYGASNGGWKPAF